MLLLPMATMAQPVIQYANLNPVGSSYAVHVVTDPGASDPNTDGAGVTWDFSSATLLMNAGSVTFVDPASTPYGASYPTSDLAQEIALPGGTTYTYFDLSTTQLDMLAQGVGGSEPRIYTDPKTPLVFPFAYPDWFIDYYSENGTDYSVSRAYMGYGTVILPMGTYTNVVKMASTSGSIDFFRSNPVAQLVQISEDGEVLVFTDAEVGVQENERSAVLSAWPNPAADQVRIDGVSGSAAWHLLDGQGRSVQQGNHAGGALLMDLAPLAVGRYLLVVHSDEAIQRTVLVRQ